MLTFYRFSKMVTGPKDEILLHQEDGLLADAKIADDRELKTRNHWQATNLHRQLDWVPGKTKTGWAPCPPGMCDYHKKMQAYIDYKRDVYP